MKTNFSNNFVFAITLDDLQFEAKEKIGRELTEDEIEFALPPKKWTHRKVSGIKN